MLYNLADASSRDRFFDEMPLRRRVDAVAVLSMPLTEGQVAALSGPGVPEDISVVGFDDHELAGVLEPTTVEQPVAEQGNLIAQILLDLLESGEGPPPTTVLPTRLVVRGGTRPVRAG